MDVELPYGMYVRLERECDDELSPPARQVTMLFGSHRTPERAPSGFSEQLMLLSVCTAASFILVNGSTVSVSCPNGLPVRLDIRGTTYVVTIPNGTYISTSPTGRFSSHSPSYQNLLREGHQVTVPVDTRDFSDMEALVQRQLSQSMAADPDRMALGDTSSDTARTGRVPRTQRDLYDALRLAMSLGAPPLGDQVAMRETLTAVSEELGADDEPVEGILPRRLIRIRRE